MLFRSGDAVEAPAWRAIFPELVPKEILPPAPVSYTHLDVYKRQDHRIGLTIHQLAEIMEGKLQPVIDALIGHFTAERLKSEAAA